LLKLDAANSSLDTNNVYYYDVFGFSQIYVKEIFPDTGWGEDIDPDGDSTTEKGKYIYRHFEDGNNPMDDYPNMDNSLIPISLYDAKEKTYGFGLLVVETYTK